MSQAHPYCFCGHKTKDKLKILSNAFLNLKPYIPLDNLGDLVEERICYKNRIGTHRDVRTLQDLKHGRRRRVPGFLPPPPTTVPRAAAAAKG